VQARHVIKHVARLLAAAQSKQDGPTDRRASASWADLKALGPQNPFLVSKTRGYFAVGFLEHGRSGEEHDVTCK
jgi:hypothetical protein